MVLYGDSQAFGWGLDEGERFSNIVEQESTNLEIWNRSVPGYGLDQAIISYEQNNPPFADEILLLVSDNTLQRIHSRFIYAKYKPVFVPDQSRGLMMLPPLGVRNAMINIMYRVLSPFYLPYFLQTQLSILQQTFRSLSGSASNPPPSANPSSIAGELALSMLRRASITARERNQRLTLVLAELPPADQSAVVGLCNEIGITYFEIDPLRAIGNIPRIGLDESIFGEGDGHWTAKANQIIAAQLLLQIRTRE
jgi:hypothetical protein